MYAHRVIERNIRTIEKGSNLKFSRYDYSISEEWSKHIQALWIEADKRTSRPLTTEEAKFVQNEQILCQLDFRYWAERYCVIRYDGAVGGGIGKMRLGDAQELLLKLISKIQDKQYAAVDRGEPVDGILIADHKARQVWHTALARALTLHRATLHPHSNIFAGSVDDQKLQILYDRDVMSYEALPWFLRPERGLGEKSDHMGFKNNAKITYMASNKKSSFGQGDQFNVGHCTELSEYPYPGILEIDFFPTLPQHPDTLCVLESRANGRGNWWHNFSEDCRRGKKERWAYSFCPWYTEPRKYRRQPKVDWEPDEAAMLHAKKVYDTSPEFVGHNVSLGKEQLYWWWSTREEYRTAGRLNYFLSNYCATPEESFQHSGESAFDPELLDDLRLRAREGEPFEFIRKESENKPTPAPGRISYHIPHCGSFEPVHEREIDWDKRGILWISEHPKPNAHYVMGVDPTRGIVGWDRTLRKEDDAKTDNGAIQVIRCGRNGNPDVQVAEFAAPVDAEDLGDIANAVGRMYGGDNEDGQALAIIEVWPGPGEPCQRRMITKYGYTHLYIPIRFANTLAPEQGRNTVGWVSNARSRRDLWIRGTKHIVKRNVRINSPYLVEEMADCQADDWMVTETARARYGKHDDRVVALMLAIYAANDWSWEFETEKVEVTQGSSTNWQASDMSVDSLMDAWEDRFSEISD